MGEERRNREKKTVVDISMLDSIVLSCFISLILFLNKIMPGLTGNCLKDNSPQHSLINYSLSHRSKPVSPLFIFKTQIKIFLMHSESSLTLHKKITTLLNNLPSPRHTIVPFW